MSVLVIGIGNPSRGDDALGPLLVERLEKLALPGVELLTDFQLQVEYVLDLHGRDRVVFADASVTGQAPFEYHEIAAQATHDYSSHALPPEALLRAYMAHYGAPPPRASILAIRGYGFELGEALSGAAQTNLDAAACFLEAELSPG